jgi:hypothetical protein
VAGASVGYGSGHYLIAGSLTGPVVLESTDGETRQEHSLDGPACADPGLVTHGRVRFLYVNLGLWGSPDGEQWSALSHDDPYAFLGEM